MSSHSDTASVPVAAKQLPVNTTLAHKQYTEYNQM